MTDLLDNVLLAHGGIAAWNRFNHVRIQLKVAGHIWEVKGVPGIFSEGVFDGDLHKQESAYQSSIAPFERSHFEHGLLTIESEAFPGKKEILDPRKSFAGEALEVQWKDFQPHYFGNYAWWTYFTAPFNFMLPGYEARELTPWKQDGESWRRLEVTFPDYIETHNKVQVFYYDRDFLLKRHDYAPDILNGIPSSQYVWNYKKIDGIYMPMTRKIFLRNPDGGFNPVPEMVTLDILDVHFT